MAIFTARFAHHLLFPLVLMALAMLYAAWEIDERYAYAIAPFVLAAAIVYILQPQINWYWYSRHLPELAPPLRALLDRQPFYRNLSHDEKARFRGQVALFTMGVDWMPMAFPDDQLPPDVEMAIAAQGLSLSFYQEKFLFERFEKVVVYPYPFPTEQHPYAHASELYEPDGCLLFSAEQVMNAWMHPDRWFNVALYEYARVFALTYPLATYPDLAGSEATLERISGMSLELIAATLGLPEDASPDLLAVSIHHHRIFPERFRQALPDVATAFDQIFHPYRPIA